MKKLIPVFAGLAGLIILYAYMVGSERQRQYPYITESYKVICDGYMKDGNEFLTNCVRVDCDTDSDCMEKYPELGNY